MTISLPSDYIGEKNTLIQSDPWIWLIELWASDTVAIRITPYLQSVTWPFPGGNVYYPYPCLPPAWQSSSEGQLPNAEMVIPNPDDQLTPLLDAHDGLRDKRVISRLAHVDHLDETTIPEAIWDIARVTTSREVVTFTLGPLHVHEHDVPRHTYNRTICRWVFGSQECGYDLTRPGAKFSTCGKTFEDCKARGQDEVDAGLPRNHPKRYGAFPAIAIFAQ